MSSSLPTRQMTRRATLLAAAAVTAGAVGGANSAYAYGPVEDLSDKSKPKPKKKTPEFIREGGIAYADLETGSGPSPGDGDFVIVDYIAYLKSGVVFDNTKQAGRKSLVFQMGQNKVIPGLEIAIKSMAMGGHRLAIIPPSLAYGERGVCFPEQGCLVPPDETLEYGMFKGLDCTYLFRPSRLDHVFKTPCIPD